MKKVFLEISQNLKEHLCQRVFFNIVAGLSPEACNFIKKDSLPQVFSCEFWKISESTSF